MNSHESLSSSELYRGLGLVIPTKEVTRQDLFERRILPLQSSITSHMNTLTKEENIITRRASLRASWSQKIRERAKLGEEIHWSTSPKPSNYAKGSRKPELESLEEKFKYWQKILDKRQLVLRLATEEVQEYLGHLQYERLLADVKEPSPTKQGPDQYRGEVERRIFWCEVRHQLNVVDDEGELDWPEGFSEPSSYTPDTLQDCLTFRQPIFDGEVDIKW
jgi:hypothetical protein